MTTRILREEWACGKTSGKYNGAEIRTLPKQWKLDQAQTILLAQVFFNVNYGDTKYITLLILKDTSFFL